GGVIYLFQRAMRGEGKTLAKIIVLPLSVWSMSLAHIGAGVLTIGAIAETAFRVEQTVALAPTQSVNFAGRRITMLDTAEIEGPNYHATRAEFRVDHRGDVFPLHAERRFFLTSPMPTTEVGIHSGLDGDLYLAIGDVIRDSNPQAYGVRLYFNPLVYFIFLG